MAPKRVVKSSAAATNGPETRSSTSNGDTQAGAQNGTAEASRPTSAASTRQAGSMQPPPTAAASGTRQVKPSRPTARPRGVGRRSQQGRAELEKAELERKQAEAANREQQKQLERRAAARGRGSIRGRQRGGYVGDSLRTDSSAIASGPFSLGQVTKDSGRRIGGGSGRPGGPGGFSGAGGSGGRGGGIAQAGASASHAPRVKQETSTGDVSMTGARVEDGGFVPSDSEDESHSMPKVNIDQLVDLTLDDDEQDEVTYLPPVRIQRHEHIERTAFTAAEVTTAQTGGEPATISEKRRGKQRARPNTAVKVSSRYKGTYTDSSESEVDVKQEHGDHVTGSPPTSPDTRRKAKAGIRADSFDGGERPGFQTKEEEIEWRIKQNDLRMLQSELGHLPAPSGEDELPDAIDDPRADKMYLFQFPAILPALTPINTKQEDGDIDMQDIPEADATTAPPPAVSAQPTNRTTSGMVGKLRVHKSGCAYLDWGGIPMELSMGQTANFLQDVVIVDTGDMKPDPEPGSTEHSGTVMSMGQVKGRFIVTPQWDAIFDRAY